MDNVTRTALFANPEVQKVIAEIGQNVRKALPECSFAQLEEAALAILNEGIRSLLEEELKAISAGLGEHVLVDGVEYKRHEPGMGKYHCLGGPIMIERFTYRPVGVHNGKTIVPLELVAGLAEHATPALAYNIIYGYGQHDMRQHGESLATSHRIAPPRATLERMAKRLAKSAHDAAPKIEATLRQTEAVPEGAKAVSIGLDRTAVPMAEERPADAPPKPERKRSKPRKRRAPKPIDINWRMAYVGTVSIIDENGEALATRRYALPACDNPSSIVTRMAADVRAMLRRESTLAVGIVQDGAPEMWNVARYGLAELKRKGVLAEWKEAIDRFHLLERLAAALEIIESDPVERKRRLHEWNELLDARDSAIDKIEDELTRQCVDLSADKEEAMLEHLVYIENNKDRMRYASVANAGLPIGSGVTESAAKTVIGRRAKNSGQRWSESGLRGALTLRAMHQSGRLPKFWNYLSRRYTADIAEAA